MWRELEVNPGYPSGGRLLVHGGHHGPVGIFEIPDFATGTRQLAEVLAASSAKTSIDGRDSLTAVKQLSLARKIDFYFDRRRRISGTSGRKGIARSRGPFGSVIGIGKSKHYGWNKLKDEYESQRDLGAKKKPPRSGRLDRTRWLLISSRLMDEKNVGARPAVDNGKLVGIVSERDYTRKVILQGKILQENSRK